MPLTIPPTILISLGIVQHSATSEAFSSSGQFDAVPEEVVENILVRLPPRNLIPTLSLNRRLNAVIFNSTQLQYHLALCAYGMVDGNSSMSAKDKLAELIRREEGWRTSKFSRQLCEPDQYTVSDTHNFRDGVLGGHIAGNDPTKRDCDLWIYDFSSCRSDKDDYRYLRISPASGDCVMAIGLAIQEHDLLCFVQVRHIAERENEITVHLRQYSTRHPHPRTMKTEICTQFTGYEPESFTAQVEIVGPWLLLLLSEKYYSNGSLLLIHWSSGEIVLREDLSYWTYGRFIVLAQDLIIFPRPLDSLLEIIKLPDPERLVGITDTHFRRIARLHLPNPLAFTGRTRLYSINCHAAAYQSLVDTPQIRRCCDTESSSSASRAYRQYPFSPDPESGIVLVRICPYEDSNFSDLVVHRKTLIKAAKRWNALESDEVKNLSWEDWAYERNGSAVRWFYNTDTKSFDVAIFGQKLAILTGNSEVVVRDFNAYAFKLTKSPLAANEAGYISEEDSESPSDGEGSICSNDTAHLHLIEREWNFQVFEDNDIYPGEEVEGDGGLPYVEITKALVDEIPEQPYWEVYMDGERMICTFPDEVVSGKLLQAIHVYNV